MRPAEDIAKAKQLLDQGAISRAEFEKLKSQILSASAPVPVPPAPVSPPVGQRISRTETRINNMIGLVLVLGLVLLVFVVAKNGGGQTDAAGTDSSGWNEAHQMAAIKAKRVLASRLNDPDSVKHKNVFSNGSITCGLFNARNAMGGYGEWQPFIGMGPGEPKVLVFDDKGFRAAWEAHCISLTGFSQID